MSSIYRPKAIQNVVFRLSAAMLVPGQGFQQMFDNSERHGAYYSVLANATLSF